MKTKAQSAFEFISEMISIGKTVYISTAIKSTKITPATFTKWLKSDYKLFKFNDNGDLLMARGKKYDCIVSKNITHVRITAQ